VLLRNLFALTPMSEEIRIAVDLIIQEKLQIAAKSLVEDQGVYNPNKAPKSQAMRYLK
jgi:hypothetical protein